MKLEQLSGLSGEGYENLELLKSYLRDRVRATGKTRSVDKDGNEVYTILEIFSDSVLNNFLMLSLSEFNQIPTFTSFTFDDTEEIERYSAIIVEGALLYCLTSQSLIERGREFSFTDDGISFTPPSIADIMMSQYQTQLPLYWKKLRLIKQNIK